MDQQNGAHRAPLQCNFKLKLVSGTTRKRTGAIPALVFGKCLVEFSKVGAYAIANPAFCGVAGCSSDAWNFTLTILLTPCSCIVTP